jgi:SAM-dependent methyltransferase
MDLHPESDPYASRAPLYGERVPTYRDPELVLAMLEGLHLDIPLRALDLAAGQGDASRHLRALGADVTYVDRSREMLDVGINRGLIPDRKAFRLDLSSIPLPFQPESFDVVTMRYALHDILDKHLFFMEVARLLTLRGSFQIVDMCASDGPTLNFLDTIHSLKTTRQRPEQVSVATESALQKLATNSGFIVSDTRWYRSQVSAEDWLAEGQITPDRHEQLRAIVGEWTSGNPTQAQDLRIRLSNTSFQLEFPVIVMTFRWPGVTRE